MRHNFFIGILVIASFFSSIAIGATSIVAPWLLLKSFPPFFFSVLACVVAVISIFFLPMLGRGLKHWRAKDLLGGASLGMAVLLFLAYASSRRAGGLDVLIAVVFNAMEAFFLIFIAARITLVKRIVPETQYSKVSTILEMEFQIAAFGAGALAAHLLGRFDPSFVLFLISGLFLLSAGLFMAIEETKGEQISVIPKHGTETNISETGPGFPIIALVLAMNVPFVCIMLMNVILPIHIAGTLAGSAQDLAVAILIYTSGAISSFLLIWFVLARAQSVKFKMIALFLVFSAAAAMAQYSVRLEVLFWCCFIWGAINSTAKVAAQTAILKHTDIATVSVVTAKVQVHVQILRVISMVMLSLIILFLGEDYLFGYMAIFALLGPALILVSMTGKSWVLGEKLFR